ncbi:hypothetical protein L596_015498 [Steinernema carpocapsae]|uniref:Uncharacterized protein n=1 Tax=Steinernema carpocapsae TaxID=34508 RepID=A0A4U5NG64_STECR|nr:hypothetical protein L596_015498 [Steinernema carpocapsae]
MKDDLQFYVKDLTKRLAVDAANTENFWEEARSKEAQKKSGTRLTTAAPKTRSWFNFSAKSFWRTPTFVFLGLLIAYHIGIAALITLLFMKFKRPRSAKEIAQLETTYVSMEDTTTFEQSRKSNKNKNSKKNSSKKKPNKQETEETEEVTATEDY